MMGTKRRIANHQSTIKRHCHHPTLPVYPLKPLEMLCSVTNQEEITRILCSHSEWLSDVVDAAQALLVKQFPDIMGLQSTVILQGSSYGGYAPKDFPFVQIINVKNHWVTLSNFVMDIMKPGIANLYDSLHRKNSEIPTIVKKVTASLMFMEGNTSITVQLPKCKQQNGSSDCGLFAIANATALCFRINPSSCVWKQSKMRQHLASCISNGKMEMFPHDICQPKGIVHTTTFSVFCHCRLSYEEGDTMIECDRCKSWYHQECENISSSRWQKLEESNMAYICSMCQQSSRFVTIHCHNFIITWGVYNEGISYLYMVCKIH